MILACCQVFFLNICIKKTDQLKVGGINHLVSNLCQRNVLNHFVLEQYLSSMLHSYLVGAGKHVICGKKKDTKVVRSGLREARAPYPADMCARICSPLSMGLNLLPFSQSPLQSVHPAGSDRGPVFLP